MAGALITISPVLPSSVGFGSVRAERHGLMPAVSKYCRPAEACKGRRARLGFHPLFSRPVAECEALSTEGPVPCGHLGPGCVSRVFLRELLSFAAVGRWRLEPLLLSYVFSVCPALKASKRYLALCSE